MRERHDLAGLVVHRTGSAALAHDGIRAQHRQDRQTRSTAGEWRMTLPTVNAFTARSSTASTSPPASAAAVLRSEPGRRRELRRDRRRDRPRNDARYFGDRGRQFDEAGNFCDWWTAADAEAYKARADRVAEQFSSTVLDTMHVNGRLRSARTSRTSADSRSRTPRSKATAGKPRVKIDGFTPNSVFFLAYARVWQRVNCDEALRTQCSPIRCSPAHWRVNGPLSNLERVREGVGLQGRRRDGAQAGTARPHLVETRLDRPGGRPAGWSSSHPEADMYRRFAPAVFALSLLGLAAPFARRARPSARSGTAPTWTPRARRAAPPVRRGGWLQRTPMPPGLQQLRRLRGTADRNEAVLRHPRARRGGQEREAGQRHAAIIGDYYAACLDSRRPNARAFEPLEDRPRGHRRTEGARRTRRRARLAAPEQHERRLRFGARADAAPHPRSRSRSPRRAELGMPSATTTSRLISASVALRAEYVAHVGRLFTLITGPIRSVEPRAFSLRLQLAQASMTPAAP